MTDLLLRRHFARLTLAALPHPCAFRGGGVSECVPAQFACPLTLPVFVGNDCCAPPQTGRSQKSSNPEHENLWQVDSSLCVGQGTPCCISDGFSGQATEFPLRRCFCRAHHRSVPASGWCGLHFFSLHVVFCCIGNACPFLGLLVLRVHSLFLNSCWPYLCCLIARPLSLDCVQTVPAWHVLSCLFYTFRFCFGTLRGTLLVAVVRLMIYSSCFLLTCPHCRAFSYFWLLPVSTWPKAVCLVFI